MHSIEKREPTEEVRPRQRTLLSNRDRAIECALDKSLSRLKAIFSFSFQLSCCAKGRNRSAIARFSFPLLKIEAQLLRLDELL